MSNFMFPVCKNINCGNKTEREIEKLQAQINKQADEIFKKDCEISRLEEYEQRCHRSYDAWALDPERS